MVSESNLQRWLQNYSLPEIERRWLVDLSLVDSTALPEPISIVDRYLIGTGLRLRKMEAGREVVYKLVEKYGREGWVEPITNLYLTEAEYRALAVLPANEVRKQRYRLESSSLDVLGDVGIFEEQFKSVEEATAFMLPATIIHELLGEPEHAMKVRA